MMKRVYTTPEQLPLVMSASDIAEALNLSKGKVYELLHSENFPAVQIGRRMVVLKQSFLMWLEQQSAS